MAKTVQENAGVILEALYSESSNVSSQFEIDGERIQKLIKINPQEINDAVSILFDAGYIDWLQELGTHPFDFSCVWITPRGKVEYERMNKETEQVSSTAKTITTTKLECALPAYGQSTECWFWTSVYQGNRKRRSIPSGNFRSNGSVFAGTL